MTLPVAPMVRPTDLNGQANGELDPRLLVALDHDVAHHLAARSWAAMRAAAARDAVELAVGADAYRPYETQERIFRQRYTPHTYWLPGRRKWEGQWWAKKPGVAAAAIPGTSNHGWGLAVDVDDAETELRPVVVWLKLHAAGYGWSAEIQSEPWHWRAVHGDRLPPAVLAYEASLEPAPPPVVVPPSEEDDMLIIPCDDGRAFLLVGAVLMPLSGERLTDYRGRKVPAAPSMPVDHFNAMQVTAGAAGLIAST